jgi:sodium/potassium-transporting ATPase subunit beta
MNTVWVSCEGENPADAENIGPIQYLPSRGFPGYFFPFTNKEGYLSPLVAVLFEKPASKFIFNCWIKQNLHFYFSISRFPHFL